jgi:hypothetical protein
MRDIASKIAELKEICKIYCESRVGWIKDAFLEELNDMQKIADSLKPNQFAFVHLPDKEEMDEIEETKTWLENNLSGRYNTKVINKIKFTQPYETYEIIDFGDDTEAAALFKLFNS